MSDSLKLLTLLNVAQAKPAKRPRPSARDWHAEAKKAAKKHAPAPAATDAAVELDTLAAAAEEQDDDEAGAVGTHRFFGALS